jgi:hypothetical protein
MGALFASDKKFAIAQAIISTSVGATRALREVPFPANIAAAAAVLANGYKQVKQIKATNPGTNATSFGGGSGGASPSALQQPAGNAQQAEQAPRVAQVVIQGSVFSSRETADWLVGQLSDAINNRDVVFINGNSRQAGLITGA